mmetsp:Transcript_55847/g.156698  ORF Transcript_55847/g.156698 Transcript_55847/m.156698 type:complete len:256 (-) Transcript_55847:25-792(-)
MIREGGAGPGHVHRRAGPVRVPAEAELRVGGAGHVRLRRLVGEADARLRGDLVQPLVDPKGPAAVAGALLPLRVLVDAIQHMLDCQVDLGPAPLPDDLDAVRQRRERPVSPATATILRDVLITVHGAEGLAHAAVGVAPVPVRDLRPRARQPRGGRRIAAVAPGAPGHGDDLAAAALVLGHGRELHDVRRGRLGAARALNEAHLRRIAGPSVALLREGSGAGGARGGDEREDRGAHRGRHPARAERVDGGSQGGS